MPRIIRQALAERLLESPRASAFLRDFSEATGLPLRFATFLGVELPVAGTSPAPGVCAWMRADRARDRLCALTIQEGVLESERAIGCGATCAAGLREAAVPLRLGGELFGYLLVGQVATRPLDGAALNRWRHELERIGQPMAAADLKALADGVESVPENRFEAALRLLEAAAGDLAEHLEDQLTRTSETVATPVRKACGIIRSRFDEPLRLGDVAREVGLSREHFCTLFRKQTGLRFVEYLTRVRVEQAGETLRTTGLPVIDVAMRCGFQSISHFNRRFRAIKGQTPTAYRSVQRTDG